MAKLKAHPKNNKQKLVMAHRLILTERQHTMLLALPKDEDIQYIKRRHMGHEPDRKLWETAIFFAIKEKFALTLYLNI